jgi:hypothetical protein
VTTVIRIRENASGEEREIVDTDIDYSLCDFNWTEGNMACDCNRRLEWLRAVEPTTSSAVGTCGRGMFTLVFVRVNGVEIIREDKATDAAEC